MANIIEEGIAKINPIKREQVRALCLYAKEHPVVKSIIVFGSSVRDDCREESDVDFVVDYNCEDEDIRMFYFSGQIGKFFDYNYDELTRFYITPGSPIDKSIQREGVEVYG